MDRISTMGELTASLAHELNQPIAAVLTDASPGAGQDLRCLFHHENSQDGHGTSDQSFHHRVAWWSLVGGRQLAARRTLLHHPARAHSDGAIMNVP